MLYSGYIFEPVLLKPEQGHLTAFVLRAKSIVVAFLYGPRVLLKYPLQAAAVFFSEGRTLAI